MFIYMLAKAYPFASMIFLITPYSYVNNLQSDRWRFVMVELLIVMAIALPWALTLRFSDPKRHQDINIKFCVFVGTGIVVFLLLSYFFS